MKDERITIDRAELEQLKRLATTDRQVAVYSADVDQFARLLLIFCVAPLFLACVYFIVADTVAQFQEGPQQKQLVHQK